MVTREEYRDLYLDRSRAYYEMEVRSDLGDAMVQSTAVSYMKAKAQFDWQMAYERLQAMGARLSKREETK